MAKRKVPAKPANKVEEGPIILHFTKPVEVTINGHRYEGKDVEVPSYAVASDIVRIAKEAYGSEIV